MKRLCCILGICLTAAVWGRAQERHALLVGVSDYPAASGWSKLHADSDVRLLRETLLAIDAGFHIRELEDRQATYQGIVRAMQEMASTVREGDQCLILFSCHGQQITDIDGDERQRKVHDRFDESVVPYDALIAYDWHGSGYKGEYHLRDDELNILLGGIRQSIGPEGQLIVLFDACHSGDMSRAKKELSEPSASPRRGTSDAFRIPVSREIRAKGIETQSVDWLVLSACEEYKNNYEVKIDGRWYGRLSYAFCQVFHKGMTADELVRAIGALYKILPNDPDKPIQTMTYECPINRKKIPLLK